MSEFSNRRHFGPTPKYDLVREYKRPNNDFIFIAGPCSFETTAMSYEAAEFISKHGATHMRSGVFRAGTYGSQKFGWIDRALIKEYQSSAHRYGLKNVIEVLDYRDLDWVVEYADVLQIGCRSMQSYALVRAVASTGKPVFLKRHPGSKVDEWLGAAEHALIAGCKDLSLIERGSSTYHDDVRWTPTIHTIASVASITQLPVIFDPSHSCGRRDMVPALALAGVAAGASGLLVETHVNPPASLSDPEQAISYIDFEKLASKIKKLREVL